MPYPRSDRGFTLIELMLAIGLGSLVIYTAYAGFRMASQAITVSNRLSLENSLMRAGFQMAHEQLDFWTNLDDPNDATHEQLRLNGYNVSGLPWASEYAVQPYPTTVGLPFAPLQGSGTGSSGAFPANIDPTTGGSASGSAVPRSSASPASTCLPYPAGGPMIIQPPSLPLPSPSSSTPTQASLLPAGWENDAGFDCTVAWAPHDPRTWFRGNAMEWWSSGTPLYFSPWNILLYQPPVIFGRYGAFTNVTSSPTFQSFTVSPTPAAGNLAPSSYLVPYTASTNYPPHLWYGRQMLGLTRAIGYYGLCDYLPANALYGYYTSFSQNGSNIWGNYSSAGGLSTFFTFPGWEGQQNTPYPFCDNFVKTQLSNWAWNPTTSGGQNYWNFVGSGMGPTTIGIYALTTTSSYSIVNPNGNSVDKGLVDTPTLVWRHYSYSDTDYSAGSSPSAMQDFVGITLPYTGIMAAQPGTWPSVSVAVGHYVKSAHYVHLAKIRWTSPLTGQMAEFSFDGIGSTLRGARMQRQPGTAAGWASWDNAPSAVNQANLDGPQ